jgi:site-specific recombinase XerD
MTKLTANPLPALVQSFFAHYLIHQRQLTPCTIASYRDALRLLLAYVQKQTRRQPAQQRLEDWTASRILGFLDHLETQRHCCVRSRNARLAAIHCFMRYASQREVGCLTLANQVLAIPNKRQSRPLLGYLTPTEVQAVLEAPAPDTFSGRRDRLLFQLLYNTGARASEIVALNRQDVLPGSCQTVTLHGKGRKQRTVPLWPKTSRQLRHWLEQLPTEPSTPVFVNRFGTRLSRFGLEKQLAHAVPKAAVVCPSLRGRRISPHILRHYVDLRTMPTGMDPRRVSAEFCLGRAA